MSRQKLTRSGLGPMQGQANHFFRYSSERIEYAINRYQTEVRRQYGVLERHLSNAKSEYLVGNKCTIADISIWGWVTVSRWAGVELDGFPVLKQWEERMLKRPAVERGRQVPEKHHRELLQDPKAMAEFEKQGKAFYKKFVEQDKQGDNAS